MLVNSSSAKYLDFQHAIQPYLDNFGVPYTVLDIASNAVGTDIGNYALIIIGHSQLDTNHVYLDATAQQNISMAVTNGTGLVNFDNDLVAGGTNRYQFMKDIFGFSFGSATTGTNATFPATEPLSQLHYITALHQSGGSVAFRSAMSMANITTVPSNVTAIALSSGKPFVAIRKFGQGRAVQWASYGWMPTTILGPLDGLDDLVWRGVVWAARKPFVMRGLPNFVTFRMDDVSGPLTWVHIANEMGFKPWLGLFLNNISESEALDIETLTLAGNATASIHSFDCCSKFFYWNDYTGTGVSGTNWPDSVMATNIAYGTQWHTNHGIPISKVVITHFGEMGHNVFDGLKSWGVEFVGAFILDRPFYSSAPWQIAGPYRLYETPQDAVNSLPTYYADFLKLPGYPQYDNQFFLFLTEIGDVSSCGEWCPANNDIAGSITRGTQQVRRALDSMALATLYTHEWYVVPIPQSLNQTPITTNNWRSILQGITNNLATYHPIYVTLDYALQYVRATKTSRVMTADYDPASGQVTATLSGNADMDTQVYIFLGDDNTISNSFGSVPAFASGPVTDTVAMLLPPLLTVTASNLSKVYGQTMVFAGTEFSATGLSNGDTVISASLSSAGAEPGAPVDGSPYDIVVTNAVGTGLANYRINYVNGQLTVTPADLTVAASNTNRIYGTTNPVFTAGYTGFVNEDTNDVLSGAPDLVTEATTTSPVGNYMITNTIGTLSATNYAFSFVNGTLTINPAALTVTADDKTRMYGAANPVLTASYNGFVNFEDTNVLNGSPMLNTAADPGSPVGNYPITITQGTLSSSNYSFTFSDGTLTVTTAAAPMILSIGLTNQVITVEWSSVPGANYGLQYTTNLTGWNTVSSNLMATGPMTSQTNAVGDAPMHFYRVILQGGP